MSLAEIKDAVTELTPQELAELAAFIQTRDRLASDREPAWPWDREAES